MKKIVLLFVCALGFAFAVSAQCSGSAAGKASTTACCSKSKASTASADAMPSMGADIEQRTDAAGQVSYVRKVVNAENGAITYKAVEYCTKTNAFVDVAAEAQTEVKDKDKAHCAEGAAKAGCCSSSAKSKAKAKTKA